jgi:general secretion pathway protein D
MMKRPIRNSFVVLVGAAMLLGCAATQLHRDGLAEVERGNFESGVSKLTEAVARAPDNLTYKLDLTARREASIQRLISAGDALRAAGQYDPAIASYRRVLTIAPGNQRALHGIDGVEADRRHATMVAEATKEFERKDYDAADKILRSVLNEDSGFVPATALSAKVNVARGPQNVAPRLKTRNNAKVTLQFRDAPTKMVFEVLARQTGINFVLDKDVKSDSKTTIFVQEVPIEEAIDLVLDQNSLARQILSSNMVLIYPNTPAKQKDYEEQIVHTFYLTNAVPKDVESMLKSMLGAKNLFIDERTSVVVMRDTPDAVRMAEKLVASIDVPEPEVLIEVEVLEIARSRLLNLGITPPGSFTASANPVGAAAGTATAGASGLLLSDLSHQNANTISVSSVSITANALQTVGDTNTLASPRIRARNKEKAKILIGSRVPVITSSTALLTSGTASSSSVQYLDVGLTLEVQPTVYLDGDVGIKLGMEVSTITNTVVVAGTQAYTIGTRNANTVLRLKDGETQILAGLIQDSDTRNSAGLPGVSQIPILGRLFGSNNTDREKSEIVLSITPHIIRTQARASAESTEFWYGTETRSRSSPFAGGGGFDSTAPAAPAGAGEVSGGAGLPTVGPRPSVSQPVVVTPTAAPASTPAAPAGPPAAPAGPTPHPTVTVEGPGETSVGQEFDVTVRMATDIAISRLRGQVRFDTSALQLISATAGDVVPSAAGSPTVDPKAGGAQLDVVASDDPIQGEGSLMLLRFKALAARPASAIAAQVSAMGPSGTALANAASQPLSVAIKP